MGWIVALVMISALVMLGRMLWRREGDNGWRDSGRRFAGATGARWASALDTVHNQPPR